MSLFCVLFFTFFTTTGCRVGRGFIVILLQQKTTMAHPTSAPAEDQTQRQETPAVATADEKATTAPKESDSMQQPRDEDRPVSRGAQQPPLPQPSPATSYEASLQSSPASSSAHSGSSSSSRMSRSPVGVPPHPMAAGPYQHHSGSPGYYGPPGPATPMMDRYETYKTSGCTCKKSRYVSGLEPVASRTLCSCFHSFLRSPSSSSSDV